MIHLLFFLRFHPNKKEETLLSEVHGTTAGGFFMDNTRSCAIVLKKKPLT